MNDAQKKAQQEFNGLVGQEPDHPNAVRLVNRDGTLTKDGVKLMMQHPLGGQTNKHTAALHIQAIRQEVYGVREK